MKLNPKEEETLKNAEIGEKLIFNRNIDGGVVEITILKNENYLYEYFVFVG